MYQIGELVMYGSSGVCEVKEIKEQVFPSTGEQRLYYVLESRYEHCMISAPVDSDKVFLRPIITKEEAVELIDSIPGLQAEVFHSRVSRELTEHYEQMLKSHDCASLLALTRSIYLKKQELLEQKRKVGSVDERFLKRAENLLFGELAAALGIEKDQVPAFIAERIEA